MNKKDEYRELKWKFVEVSALQLAAIYDGDLEMAEYFRVRSLEFIKEAKKKFGKTERVMVYWNKDAKIEYYEHKDRYLANYKKYK